MTYPDRSHPEFRLESSANRTVLQLSLSATPTVVNHADDVEHTALVIPQAGVPRWVLPEDTRRAVKVLSSWTPYSLKSIVQWKIVIAACRFAALKRVPGTLEAQLRFDWAYWDRWLPGFRRDWAMILYIGHPSPTRKVVIFFVDEEGTVKAVAKVPIERAAGAAIVNEAAILRAVKDRMPLPEVLFSDEQEGIAAQSWIEGTSVPNTLGRQEMELLVSLAVGGVTVQLSEFRDRLAQDLGRYTLPVDAALLAQALSLIEAEEPLPCFIEHRDFAPWNIRRVPDGRLTLIDWEWALAESLPWQDVCRYFYMPGYLFRKDEIVWDQLVKNALLQEYCRRFALSHTTVRALTLHYLLRLLHEDFAEGNLDKVAYVERQIRAVLEA